MVLEDSAYSVIVLDFETTGLSPNQGDRAIEIGAVLIENGKITDTFQQLMNPGFPVDGFVEEYTGISNQMLSESPRCDEVMALFCDFIGEHNLVAHNASFDQRFLEMELDYIDRKYSGSFACSMLAARRLYQNAPNHKLGGLVEFKSIPTDGVYHRALADSEMTAKLWLIMLDDIVDRYDISPTFAMMQKLSREPKASVGRLLRSYQ